MLAHPGGLDDAAHRNGLAELSVVPVGEGVVEHGDARGRLEPGIRALAEDDDPPAPRWVRLQGLERELADGNDRVRPSRAEKRRGLTRIPFQHGPEKRQPRLAAAFEERFELKGIRLAHSRQSTGP